MSDTALAFPRTPSTWLKPRSPVILDWTPQKARAFGKANLSFRHELHREPRFSDAGLAATLDAYPRDRLGVFTMGTDPVDWTSWRRGDAGDLSGAQLLEAVEAGRIWLNLRAANHVLPDYAALGDEIFADKERNAPVRTLKRDVGLLISSPNAQVFYHLDTPLVSLWQVRGQKRVWLYPPQAPFVGDEQLERIVLRETAEQFDYSPAWDDAAEVHDLTPGRDGDLAPERASPDRERPDGQCLAVAGVHDAPRHRPGQPDLRKRRAAPPPRPERPHPRPPGRARACSHRRRPRGQGAEAAEDLRAGAAGDLPAGCARPGRLIEL